MKDTANNSKPAADEIRRVFVDELFPCPENEQLYRPVDPKDPDVIALAESIKKDGLREPLVITEDDFILSGHRRFAAAKLAGLRSIPCRVEPISYFGTDTNEIVRLLREYNRQRVKSRDEVMREEVVSADPDVAYASLLQHRRQKSDMSEFSGEAIELSARKQRSRIGRLKQDMLQAALKIINDREEFWPLSDRQVHYALLNDPPLRNISRPESRYANNVKCYHDLCDLLTRARLVGQIPWRAIADETRPVTQWRCHANVQAYIRKEMGSLFRSYARDLQRTQPNHIEIVAEKLTVKSLVERVASVYCIPVTTGRGYCSVVPRYEMAQRFKKSGKEKLIVLVLSDFDPDGEAIAESYARSMRDDFSIESVVPIKVALTGDQVQDLGLQPQMQAKASSPHHGKFVERHGTDVFELEAVPPETLQELLTDAIDSVLDLDLYNEEVDAEHVDAAFLEGARQRACRALAEVCKEAG